MLVSHYMAENKEKATVPVRVYPSTRKRLNIKAAKKSTTLAEIIDALSKEKTLSVSSLDK